MEESNMAEAKNYKEVSVESLVPFANHPFTQYEGQRFTDMVESIRANGIITPIVVRPTGKGQHEILSGHNRVSAAKEAGLKTVPAIIRSGLTDDEAMLIVTETNLIQRSFADLKHSERAIALATHYDAMKKKSGYRSDLLEEIDKLTSSPVGTRLATKDRLAEQYGLSKNTIMRYLRVNKLIAALKERLDNGGIGMRVAEALSYLRVKEQAIVENILATGKRISIKQADELHKESKQGELGKKYINRVFEVGFFPTKVKPVKFSGQFLSQYFDEKQSSEEIESVMAEALARYFENK
jgi:ParB family chromosome partitioning protein